MKKLALLITCLLTISTAGLAGCNMNTPAGDAARNRITDFVQDVLPQTENNDNSDGSNGCEDGNCEDGNCEHGKCEHGNCEKENHNFRLTQPVPRTPHTHGNEDRTIAGDTDADDEDNGEYLPPPKARKPHRKHGHGTPIPAPNPLPAQPEN